MKKTKSFQKKPEKLLGNEREGLLVAHFGASAEVEDSEGHIIRCHLPRNLEFVITGDRVLWRPEADNAGVIVALLPRKSLLVRPEQSGKLKPAAANIDAIIIATAPPPVLSEHLIDRYIVAAENLKITPIILLNKIDLLDDNSRPLVMKRLSLYEKIGYRVIYSSAITKDGLSELDAFLHEKTCVLVGQSGVGKSSITSTFVPDRDIRVGETSAKGLGKHTTTMTRLFHLPHGGNLIDSPGVREFGLWHMNKDEILQGFVELRQFTNRCRFRDCQHTNEPGCVIQKAIEDGEITTQRFESYKEMIAS